MSKRDNHKAKTEHHYFRVVIVTRERSTCGRPFRATHSAPFSYDLIAPGSPATLQLLLVQLLKKVDLAGEIGTDMSASVCKSNPPGRKTGQPDTEPTVP